MFFANLFSSRKASTRNSQPKRARLAVEGLEDRWLLSAVVFNEPANRDITTVALPAGNNYHITGSYRTDPDTAVPWYQDVDDYIIPLAPNSLLALKANTPAETHLMPAYADLTYKGYASDGTTFYFNENKTSTTIRASSINTLGNYSFDLTTTPWAAGASLNPDLQVSNLRVTGGTATFDYRIADPIPNRLNLVLNFVDLIGIKADGSSTYLKTRSFSTDPASVSYSPNSCSIDLSGINLKTYAKLRIVASPSGWTESKRSNNMTEVTLGAQPPDIRLNSAIAVNGTLTVNATITGSVTNFLIGLYMLPQGVTSPSDPAALRVWNINARVNGQEGTFNFAVPIGPSGAHLPGAGADGQPGDYTLFAVADPDGKVAETNELNNAAPLTGWYANGNNLFVQGGSRADAVRIVADEANKRVLFTLNGDTYAVQTNQGLQFNVRTHGGDDRLEVNAGNGSQRIVVSAFGGPGRNTIQIVGSAGNDTATLFANPLQRSSFVGSNYGAWFSDFADAVVTGGGGTDSVTLYDSPGTDTLTYKPNETTLEDSARSYTIKAVGFASVKAYSRSGNNDWAMLYGSNYDKNSFVADKDKATLTASNRTVEVSWFTGVMAFGNPGGTDTAKITGSAGGGRLNIKAGEVELLGGGVSRTVRGFRSVETFAGGTDATAYFWGNGASGFAAYSDHAKLSGTNFAHTVWGFKRVSATAAHGGSDTATFYGTSDAVFRGDTARAEMTVSGAYENVAVGFATVSAYGGKSAYLAGSGGRDLLKASNIYANLTGNVNGASFSLYVKGFNTVWVDGNGNSQAMLYDSLGNDTLTVGGTTAILKDDNNTYALVLKKFSQVRAVSQQGGTDRIVSSGNINFQLESVGSWQS